MLNVYYNGIHGSKRSEPNRIGQLINGNNCKERLTLPYQIKSDTLPFVNMILKKFKRYHFWLINHFISNASILLIRGLVTLWNAKDPSWCWTHSLYALRRVGIPEGGSHL